jgi:predicted metal-binding protein
VRFPSHDLPLWLGFLSPGYGGALRFAPEVQVAKKYINGTNKSVKKFNKQYFDFSQLALIKFGFSYGQSLFPPVCHLFEICTIEIQKILLHIVKLRAITYQWCFFEKNSCRRARQRVTFQGQDFKEAI